MLSLTIEDRNIERIFLKEFNSDKDKFINFIKNSFEKLKTKETIQNKDIDLIELQNISISKTWNNDKDKAWDEL